MSSSAPPTSVNLRGNNPPDPQWVTTLKPGSQHEQRRTSTTWFSAFPVGEDLVDDSWTDIFRNLEHSSEEVRRPAELSKRQTAMLMEVAEFQKMNGVRARVDQTVNDPATADALKPWYHQFCKRPTFNDDYLPTFNRPNVKLINTSDSQGVERITKTGIVANGVEYPVDCIIFATGFEVGTAWTRRAGYEVIGMNGATLTDYRADGMKTYHGFSSHGFPNCFILGQSQNSASVDLSLGSWTTRPAHRIHHRTLINQAFTTRLRLKKSETHRSREIKNASLSFTGARFLANCHPGYYDDEAGFGTRSNSFSTDAYAPDQRVRHTDEEVTQEG